MAKNNVVEMPLSSDQSVIHFRIGGKQYPLRIPQQSDRTGRSLAAVVMIDDRALTRNTNRSAAAAAELDSLAHNHDLPSDAVASGLTPDNLPSVDQGAESLLRRESIGTWFQAGGESFCTLPFIALQRRTGKGKDSTSKDRYLYVVDNTL